MSFINYSSKEINCKIVYYGPGLSGKTATLKYIYNTAGTDTKGKLIAINNDSNRTLFFDFLPLDLGNIRGFKTKFHLYSVPGHIMQDNIRKTILKGIDGIVFVADSQLQRLDSNKDSLKNLEEHLTYYGYETSKIPMVFQFNKKDLPNTVASAELSQSLNKYGKPEFDTIALEGKGVYDTLKHITKMVLNELKGSS
jgi:signal recognition particle receptor subunit beta